MPTSLGLGSVQVKNCCLVLYKSNKETQIDTENVHLIITIESHPAEENEGGRKKYGE